MLKTRVITTCALFSLIALIFTLANPLIWSAFVFLFMVAAVWEWGRLAGLEPLGSKIFTVLAACLFLLCFLQTQVFVGDFPLLLLLSACFWIGVVPWVLRYKKIADVFKFKSFHLLVAIMVIATTGWSVLTAYAQKGGVFLVSLMSLVWVADIGAYFVGKRFGKRLLAPTISPGKTWEGAIGALILVFLYGWLLVFLGQRFSFLSENWASLMLARWHPLMLSAFLIGLAGFSIVGDLFESLLKRRVGVKDSSQLLPGHGGVLDRIDAQLPVLPLGILLLGFAS